MTGLSAQKRNPNRINVELDGIFAFGLERITAAWLQVGANLSDQEIESLRQKDGQEKVYLAALRLINYRPRSTWELRKRLGQKGYDSADIELAVSRLMQNGLVDDRQFAESWVEDREAFHPRSRRLLALELRQKGIQPEVVSQALDSAGEDENLLREAAKRWVSKHSGLDERQFRSRLTGYLVRRGFGFGAVYPVVSEFWRGIQEEKTQST